MFVKIPYQDRVNHVKCRQCSYPGDLPANPDHERSKKVAGQELDDREGRGKDGQHEEGNDKAVDAGVDA